MAKKYQPPDAEMSAVAKSLVDSANKATTLADKAAAAAGLITAIGNQTVSQAEALQVYQVLEPKLWLFYPGLANSEYWLVTAWVYGFVTYPIDPKPAVAGTRAVRAL